MNKYLYICAILVLFTATGCDSEDPLELPTITLGNDQTASIDSKVSLDGSAMNSTGQLAWTVTGPDGMSVSLENATTMTPSFIATMTGQYMVELLATNADGESTGSGMVTVNNVTYNTKDMMGRPAINTVFNFFGDAATKNEYNQTKPSDGAANAAAFKGIFDALQGYIGLDPAAFVNILGLDNETTAGVLAVDVLGSDKSAASAYGTLNGRALGDDVVDVTLLLAFADQSGNTSPLIDGLISDNVGGNDKDFSTSFPYLASPH